MKKFLFSLTMLAAVALAGFTTSCADGGDNDPINPGNTDSYIYKTYSCNVIVEGMESSFENILVNVRLNETKQVLDLSLSGLDLHSLAPALTEPVNINLDNVPYNKDTYSISYGAIEFAEQGMEFDNNFTFGSVSITLTSEATADLYYLTGDILGENANLQIAVFGKGLLPEMDVIINVTGIEKK